MNIDSIELKKRIEQYCTELRPLIEREHTPSPVRYWDGLVLSGKKEAIEYVQIIIEEMERDKWIKDNSNDT